ncbi:isochorismatase family protein [Fictibacillus fluitans]|uniref:Isochorismatase family protein n=1 Tax=Fictibacillus fluitans TaxID=3058422 RepID=A0ABT8I3F3_9BACL|nr:isochorismatase family protein [Fictibacillus sp. NE201]MDN4527560.1 isochorismatase family protein [Fictibacillus sp. NE201]
MKQALLIIDAQQELMDGNKENEEVYQKKEVIQTINKIIDKATHLKVPVVAVRDLDVAGGRGDGFLVHSDIQLPADTPFFDKSATSAFYGTGLLEHLQKYEIKHLVVAGCKTEHCIDTAVRMATVQGFDVTLIKEGHSTTSSKSLSAKEIIQHHNEILHGHYNVDHFSMVRSADEDVFQPLHDKYR